MQGLKHYGQEMRIVRYDNAGENVKHIQDAASKAGIKSKMTAPHTPQQNGVVERRIAVLKDMGMTMMTAANLSDTTRRFL